VIEREIEGKKERKGGGRIGLKRMEEKERECDRERQYLKRGIRE